MLVLVMPGVEELWIALINMNKSCRGCLVAFSFLFGQLMIYINLKVAICLYF